MSTAVLDTNGYAAYLSGDSTVLDALSEADVIYLSIFMLAELYTGFKGGTRERENLEILRRFLDKPGVSVLDATRETADFFAMINDVWIAAHALATGSILITYDKHFTMVPGLRVWNKGFL